MPSIRRCALPDDALLRKYLFAGAYADCYATEVEKHVSHAEYVEAFYTTAVFKLERLLLGWFAGRPSTDLQARELARGSLDAFAAWTVEGRSPGQLLLSDATGRTRSWLMIASINNCGTRLYFGSAVIPATHARAGNKSLGFLFGALLGFHKLYSRILLLASSKMLMNKRN
jgi:hypothetical protein